MGVHLTFARRAAMLRLLPLAAVVAYLYAHDRTGAWNDYWVASSGHVAESTVFLGPLVAGAAAWDVKRHQRAGSIELEEVAARSAVHRTIVSAVASATWVLPAYLTVLVVQWVQMRPETVGWPSVPLLAVGFGVISFLALLGAVAGTFLPRFVGPAIVAVAAYLWLVFPPSWNSEISGHFSVSRSACCPLNVVIDGHLIRAQALYLSALCLLLLAIVSSMTPWVRHITAPRFVGSATTIVLLVGAVLTGVVSAPSMLEPNRDGFAARPPPAAPACAGAEPQVCVWPEEREDLASLERAAADLSEVVRAVEGDLPARLADPGLFPGDEATTVVAPQGDGEPYDLFLARFARYLLPPVPACAYLDDGQGIVYPGVGIEPLMVAYLTDRAGHPETARAVAGELLTPFLDATVAAPIEAQRAWFASNVQVMATCDHEPVLAPA